MHAGDALGAGQSQRFGAGGQHEDLVREGAGRGVELAGVGPYSGDLGAQAQVDAQFLEVDVEGHVERGVLGLAEQYRLGQRGPVVGLVGFGAEEGDGAGEALFPQGHRRLHPGHSGTDDHDTGLRLLRLLAHPASLAN